MGGGAVRGLHPSYWAFPGPFSAQERLKVGVFEIAGYLALVDAKFDDEISSFSGLEVIDDLVVDFRVVEVFELVV